MNGMGLISVLNVVSAAEVQSKFVPLSLSLQIY